MRNIIVFVAGGVLAAALIFFVVDYAFSNFKEEKFVEFHIETPQGD